MSTVYLSEHAHPLLRQYISGLGHSIHTVRETNRVYPAVSAHPDIYFCRLGINGPVFRGDPEKLEYAYPGNIRYNAACTGKFFIHNLNYTDPALLAAAENTEKINVRQGYAKCSTVIVAEDAIITADGGIAKACRDKLDVLEISPGHVKLTGFPCGFLGGASGRIGEEIIFHGNLAAHPDGERIIDFIRRRGLTVKYFTEFLPEDIGSIL